MLRMGAHTWDRGSRGWYVRVYTAGTEERIRVPEGEAAAVALCAAINRQQVGGALWAGGGTSRPLPAAAMLAGWVATYGPLRSERTQATDRSRIARLSAFFGAADLRDLTDADMRRFAAATLETASGDTVAGCLSLLRRVLNLAVREGLLPRNPVPTISDVMRAAQAMSDSQVESRDAWTRDEWGRMLQLAERHEPVLAPALFFAIHTGARRGEILALRWEDVDFDRMRINFRRTARLGGGTKRLKSRSQARAVPMSAALETRLRDHLAARHRAQLQGHPAPEWVFPSPKGKPWAERNFSRVWERLRRRFPRAAIRPLRFHCTRHTFITWALESGKSIKRVSGWVGATTAVIHEHYEHAVADDGGMEFLGVEAAPERARRENGRHLSH